MSRRFIPKLSESQDAARPDGCVIDEKLSTLIRIKIQQMCNCATSEDRSTTSDGSVESQQSDEQSYGKRHQFSEPRRQLSLEREFLSRSYRSVSRSVDEE